MKELLILLAFLLMMGSAQAIVWNCTHEGEIVVIPNMTCPAVDCPTCPVLPNETIIIQNLTLPQVTSPNVTCSFDTVGFSTAITDCNKAKDDLSKSYMACDSNLTKGRMYENELAMKQNDINTCNSNLKKKEDEKNTYFAYGLIAAGIGAWFLYQQKVKPSAEVRIGRD